MKKMYEMPEIVELGEAAALTQGGYGCTDDGGNCEHVTSAYPF